MKNWSIHIKFGVIIAIAVLLLAFITIGVGLQISQGLQFPILTAFIFVGVLASCNYFKKKQINPTTQELFFNGFRTVAVAAVIILLVGFVALQLFPAMKNNLVAQYTKALQNSTPPLSANEIEKKVTEYRGRFTTMFLGYNMLMIVIPGVLASALGAMFYKR